jgi:hypothetical protein
MKGQRDQVFRNVFTASAYPFGVCRISRSLYVKEHLQYIGNTWLVMAVEGLFKSNIFGLSNMYSVQWHAKRLHIVTFQCHILTCMILCLVVKCLAEILFTCRAGLWAFGGPRQMKLWPPQTSWIFFTRDIFFSDIYVYIWKSFSRAPKLEGL